MTDISCLSCETLGSALLTYWVHSTLWLGALVIVLHFTSIKSFAVRELCWRVAMPLGFVTAIIGLWVDCGCRLNLAQLTIGEPRQAKSTTVVPTKDLKQPITQGIRGTSVAVGSSQLASDRGTSTDSLAQGDRQFAGADTDAATVLSDLEPSDTLAPANESSANVARSPTSRATLTLMQFGCISWLLVCTGGVVRWGINGWRLHRWLQDAQRHPLLDEMAQELGDRLAIRSPFRVRLLEAAQPFTAGWLRPTIIIPSRALADLPRDQLRALIAHELGHVQCGHGFWLSLLAAVRLLGFFQPLNFWAYQNWRREAELMADRWATRHCVRPKHLANCLLKVATWQVDPSPTNVLSFAGPRRDELVQRVECLVGQSCIESTERSGATARTRWAIACASILLSLFGPQFSTAGPQFQKDSGLSQQTQATWTAVQQDWQALRNDFEQLKKTLPENKREIARAQLEELLNRFERVDRHYQDLYQAIEQEVGK